MGKAPVNSFQLDESCSSKRLIRTCEKTGDCIVRPLPQAFRGKKDWQWFPKLLSANSPIVTTDFNVAFEERNVRAMPNPASGILVIRPKRPRRGFGAKAAMPILAAFKAQFSSWSVTDWSNVYAEITEVDVNIRNLADAAKTEGDTIEFTDPDFASRLQGSIAAAQNARYAR
jgi:hypothetical protein